MTTATGSEAAATLHRLWHTARGRAEPAPHYRSLHRLGPLLALPDDTWIVVGYVAAERVLAGKEFGTDWTGLMRASGLDGSWQTHPSLRLISRLLMSANGDTHTRLRRHATECVRPFLAGLSERLNAYAHEVTDRLAATGEGDLVADLAVPLGLRILTDLLGPVHLDPEELVALIKAFNRTLDPVDRETRLAEADQAALRLEDVLSAGLSAADAAGALGALRNRVYSGELGRDDAVALAVCPVRFSQ